MTTRRFPRLTAASIALAAAATTPANATWSILIADTRTGEIAVASATCITVINLQRETPVVIAGVGGATAQSVVDTTGANRALIRDRLLQNTPLSAILAELSTTDPGHNNRQYGMISVNNDALTYSGPENATWAGGRTGRIERGRPGPQDDLIYAVQGNILTGPNVVDEAVAALLTSSPADDLPQLLMSSMTAARLAGGDGRCSCNNNNPTGCGSPPPTPFKSAHVGYMIVSRLGDTNTIKGAVPLTGASRGLAELDLNNDDLPDYITATDQSADLIPVLNTTAPDHQVSSTLPLPPIPTPFTEIHDLTSADLNNDTLTDLIAIVDTDTIAAFLQTAPGTFADPVTLTLDGALGTIIPYDVPTLDAAQLIVTNPLRGRTHIIDFAMGALTEHTSFETFTTQGIRVSADTDLNADGINDYVYPDNELNAVVYHFINAQGIPGPAHTMGTSSDPTAVACADINNDGRPEIIVATSGSSDDLNTFFNTGTPTTPIYDTRTDSNINGDGFDLAVQDLNNDGFADIAVITSNARSLQILTGDGTGSFSQLTRARLGTSGGRILLSNLNPHFDTDPDYIASTGIGLSILDNDGTGDLPPNNGYAEGTHFLNFNIANQQTSSDDPVDQMEVLFDQWRTTLDNKVDAVRTTTDLPPRLLPGQTAQATIDLRDWTDAPLPITTATFSAQSFDNLLSAGAPTMIEPGIYTLPITAANDAPTTTTKLRVTVSVDGNDTTLMPEFVIPITTELADFNADTQLDFYDIALFLEALRNHNPIADLNNDANYDTDDITLFLNALN